MSYDYEQHDDSDQGPKALREALEKANKALADRDKQIADLSKKVNESSLSQIFSDKKVPANIQRWMKRDEVEASAEAVDKWLAENGSDFGWKPDAGDSAVTPEGQQSQPEEAPAAPQQSVLTPEDVAAYERVQALTGQGAGQTIASDQGTTVVNTVASKLGPDASFEAVIAELKAQGVPIESSFG